MKNRKIVNAFSAVQPGEDIKRRVFDKVMQAQANHRKHYVFKTALSFATVAAVICLLVFGSMLLAPRNNFFTLLPASQPSFLSAGTAGAPAAGGAEADAMADSADIAAADDVATAVAAVYESSDDQTATIQAASNDEPGIGDDHLPQQGISDDHLLQQGANTFYLSTYGLVQFPDGSIELRDVPLSGGADFRSSYSDGSVLYVSVNLKYGGENIERVEFYADDGFFAKQYLKIVNGNIIIEERARAMFCSDPGNAENTFITMYGYDFDVIGSSFTLYKGSTTDDYLLFLGTEASSADWRVDPPQMTIRAVATFSDGMTQEEIYTLDLAKEPGRMGTILRPPEEQERWQAEYEKYSNLLNSIPLEQCEVVPGSVQHLTYGETFEYKAGMDEVIGTAHFPISEESMESAIDQGLFDESGIFIIGSNLYDVHSLEGFDGSDGFIAVIVKNDDGTFTGMVYIVPGQLILEYME